MIEVAKLTEITAGMFSELTNLIELDMNWNSISTIHRDAFVDLKEPRIFLCRKQQS